MLLGTARAGVLVSEDSEWRYFKGLAEASSPDTTAWRSVDFNDASWLTGRGPFFYEDNTGYSGNTALTDMRGSYTSVFLRKTFAITNLSLFQSLTLNLQADDGAVVWINGVEMGRLNMAPGDPTYDGLSLPSAGEPNTATFVATNLATYLQEGTNVLAIVAFNAGLSDSTDFLVAASLSAELDTVAPTLDSVVPAPGAQVRALSTVEVIFSESVTGIGPADLLVNGVPANGMSTLSPRDYNFFFPQPAMGTVTFSWAANAGITDLALPPNAFAGATWSYVLDTNAPIADVVISEFLADNANGKRDDQGNRSDWVELYNRSDFAAELDGWFLTDDRADLKKWRFPAVVMQPRTFLLVWASGLNRTNPLATLHTNFKLSNDGEYLGLVTPRTNIVSEFAPVYPPQRADVSYGRDQANPTLVGYYPTPTPGANNLTSGPGFAPAVTNSLPGGVYTNGFLTVQLSSPSGTIRYTTDGTTPTATSSIYTAPLVVQRSTVFQARVFQDNLLPGPIAVEVYTLLDASTTNFSSNLPLLILATSGRSVNAEVRTPAVITAIEPFRGRASLRTPPSFIGNCQIELRGQSSLGFPKVAYNVELDDPNGNDVKVPLLGLPAESDWVLYNPYSDKPFLQNFLAYELHAKMGHYAPRCRFVELFLDPSAASRNRLDSQGDYLGIYLLVEKIKADGNRVDITKLGPGQLTEPEITGGYMFKKDKDSPGDLAFNTQGGSGFSSQYLKIHEPKPREVVGAQVAWLRNYLIQFERSLYAANWLTATGTNHYSNYIDVDSFVDFHWIVEFPKQIDGYRLSDYFTKDRNGKVVIGPIWDWNLSFGNADYLDGASTTGWYYPLIGEYDHIWLRRLMCGTTDGNALNGDPDFNQKITDRWGVLRTNVFDLTNLLARVDQMAAYLDEAQIRDFARWPRLGTYVWPNPPLYSTPTTYAGIIFNLKNWISGRFAWIDTQFLRAPEFSRGDAAVSPGFTLSMTAPTGSIYYTTDGSDPRSPGGAISSLARVYTTNLVIDATRRVVARARSAGRWSPPAAATFTVTTPAIVVTEINYSPARTPGSLTNDAGRFEFLELMNAGTQTVDMQGMRFTGGIEFTFPTNAASRLAPGARIVLSRDSAGLFSRYGVITNLAGRFVGSLANEGERITLKGTLGETILDISYKPTWYPSTDGLGFALVPVSETQPAEAFSQASGWRPGTLGGTPGKSEPSALSFPNVIINEVLTHTDPPLMGSIELFNASPAAADIGGWFLSDDRLTPKYRIPAGTTIPAGGYIVFTEQHFNPTPGTPPSFNLRASGDEVFLFSADASGKLTGYVQGLTLDAALNGVSFGRYRTSTGDEDFVPQASRTLGLTNSSPAVGPIVISEIMYHPVEVLTNGAAWDNTEDEFVELHNISASSVSLFDPAAPTNTWRLRDAVDFTFPQGQSMAPDERLLVVSFNPTNTAATAAFRARYGLNQNVRLFGPFGGKLANDQDSVELIQPDVVRFYVTNYVITSVLVDRVHYHDAAPWPGGADGLGFSLQRRNESLYGNDPISWTAAPPTPGAALSTGTEPAIQVGPQSQSVAPGSTVTFTVQATGTALLYQWRRNSELIPGANLATLTLNGVQSTNSGDYDVIVYNTTRAIGSSAATLVVAAAPNIQRPPQPQTASMGGSAKFDVVVAGARSLSYQWRRNGTPIPGATASTLALGGLRLTAAGSYDVVITDGSGGIAISPSALLTVQGDPTTDTDGDGMPDSYELAHGLNPNLATDASLDSDHDGASNLEEYRAGTDPQDGASVLKIDRLDVLGGVTLHLRCLDNRAYTIQYRDGVESASWNTLTTIAVLPGGTGAVREVQCTDPATTMAKRRFYRVAGQ